MNYIIHRRVILLCADCDFAKITLFVGNIFQDWLVGKAINPRIGFLDIKFVSQRSAKIALVIYQFAVAAKFYEVNNTLNYNLILAVGMHLLYIADGLWYECTTVNLKSMSHDGCGAMILMIRVCIVIYYSPVVNVIAQYNIQLPWFCLLAISGVFCEYALV